ncbi:ion transporter [Marivirga sp. S37H4]|uniref:Ion transporter n=1 Tax=Marivirga aurantiaca TaxID=2802615 RepID=A0A935CA30_9BACT|nr:ion transporter [Marivirga aurantiaca]MBK6266304.1 ion transporter [Marivirga aurantiaca]
MAPYHNEKPNTSAKWKVKAFQIIFEADTFWGKFFDVGLLLAIVLSVLAVVLETVSSLKTKYGDLFLTLEYIFTGLFLIEYILRIVIVAKPRNYIKSFFGIVDLLSILPSLIGIFFLGAQSMMIIRSLRLLRIFRIFKLTQYLGEASQLSRAMIASKNKIIIFMATVFILVSILGAVMYLVEPPESGFTNIPKSIYWAIVTLTTVGYGDIAPITPLGQSIASLVMILGYGIIAVPTGIVTSEMNQQRLMKMSKSCPNCATSQHMENAQYCYSCGSKLK